MLELLLEQYFIFILVVLLFISVYINIKQSSVAKHREKESSILIKKAYFDMDTELPNSKNIELVLDEQIARVSRHDKSFMLAVVKIDNYGDIKNLSIQRAKELIIEASNRILILTRDEDSLARIAEDKFLIVFNEYLTEENSELITQRIQSVFEKKFEHDKGMTNIEITIGLSKYPNDASDSEGLINRALHRATN
jgi:diguanylate cyclase (GGDEF)-like protein